jgi:regulatory protein
VSQKTPPPALTPEKLYELGLSYVARYATSEAKLARYLTRKINERGMVDGQSPNVKAIVEKLTTLGFVNDEHYAQMKTESLLRRGYGKQRVKTSLRQAGITEPLMETVTELDEEAQLNAAMAFAKRRRFGPFSATAVPKEKEQKQIAAFLRAGHDYAIVKYILKLERNCVQ